MRCRRCGGFLIEDRFDPNDCAQPARLRSTRCVNCGCIDDPVIRANRRGAHRAQATPSRPSVQHAPLSLLWSVKSPAVPLQDGDQSRPMLPAEKLSGLA